MKEFIQATKLGMELITSELEALTKSKLSISIIIHNMPVSMFEENSALPCKLKERNYKLLQPSPGITIFSAPINKA